MKYFLDTEFIEGFHKPLFGKKRHFIDLISIGIVAEDGREYYAISSEYDYNKASDWVKENVIRPLYTETVEGNKREHYKESDFHKWFGKSNKQIADEIHAFTVPFASCEKGEACCILYGSEESDLKDVNGIHHDLKMTRTNPEWYAYYADYDWVVFCSLFGTMMDLPSFMPMYCNDLKQSIDMKISSINHTIQLSNAGSPLLTHDSIKDSHDDYPKQENEHNALADAKWNLKLHEFIKSL